MPCSFAASHTHIASWKKKEMRSKMRNVVKWREEANNLGDEIEEYAESYACKKCDEFPKRLKQLEANL